VNVAEAERMQTPQAIPVTPPLPTAADVQIVDRAIVGRQSIRAFLPDPVSEDTVRTLLEVAARAASGVNRQPWKVWVLTGPSRDALVEKVCAAHDARRNDARLAELYREGYDYYPPAWFSPYLERRRENGWGLYGLLGIVRGEKDKMHAQHQRNFRFFDAPVGLIFTLDERLIPGALLDYGGFIQNIMVAAQARGLSTCVQAAWNTYQRIVLAHIGATPEELVVCGMALGYADGAAPVNRYRTPREPVDVFTTWLHDIQTEPAARANANPAANPSKPT